MSVENNRGEIIAEAYRTLGVIPEAASATDINEFITNINASQTRLSERLQSDDAEFYVPLSHASLARVSFLSLLRGYDNKIEESSDKKYLHNPGTTFVFRSLWDQYSDAELNLLENKNESLVRALISDKSGIVAEAGDVDLRISTLDPAAFIALSAIRHLEGTNSSDGFIGFPTLVPQEVDGQSMLPYIAANEQITILGTTPTHIHSGISLKTRYTVGLSE